MDRTADMRGITNVYALRSAYYAKHPNGHFFDSETLKFFGESLSTMRLLKGLVKVTSCTGQEHTCYMLSKLSRSYPTGPRRTYAYFDVDTLDDVCV